MKKLVSLLLLSLLFASCETIETVAHFNNIESNPDYKGGPLKKVLLVGIAKTNEGRELWEHVIAEKMKAQGVEAIASYTLIPNYRELGRDSVLAAVKGKGFDGIIVTQMVGQGNEIQHTSTDYSNVWGMSINMNSEHQSVWLYGDVHEYSRLQSIAFFQTNVFALSDNSKIWVGESETYIGTDLNEALHMTMDLLFDTLRQAGLL